MINIQIIRDAGVRIENARQYMEMARRQLDSAQISIATEMNFRGLDADKQQLGPVAGKLAEVIDYIDLADGLVPDTADLKRFEAAEFKNEKDEREVA